MKAVKIDHDFSEAHFQLALMYQEEGKNKAAEPHFLKAIALDSLQIFEIEKKNLLKSIDFLNSDKSIAGVFANQRGMYYDMWTLRHKTICPVDVWEEILDYTIKNKVTDEIAYECTLKKRKFNLDESYFNY